MGLFDAFRATHADLPNGLIGEARVVSVSVHHGDTVNQTCEMYLVISAPGVAPMAVEFSGPVKRKVWPAPGATLPILVDPENPVDYRILWDQVTPAKDAARAKAERFAALLRGEPVDGSSVSGGATATFAMMGTPADDAISRLERLAALRDSGAITEAEFAAQKAKVLE